MKKRVRCQGLLVFVIAVLLFSFHTASAQTGGYIGVVGGYTPSPDATWMDYDLDVRKTYLFGLKFGFSPPQMRTFAVEFEYSYLNPDIDRTILATAGSDYIAVEGNAVLHNFMINLIGKYPQGRIHPYVGFGFGASYFDFSATTFSQIEGVNYSKRTSFDDTVFAWQIMAGVEIDLTNNLSLDIGGRYFDTENLDDDRYNDEYYYEYYHHDHYYRERTFDFKTFIITAGLIFRF